jgi:uncharacterized protein
MVEEDLRVVRTAFEAYFRGDLPAMLETVDPDVIVTQLPDQPDFREFHGHEGLLQAMSGWLDTWDDWSIEVDSMRSVGRHVLVRCLQSGRGRGSGVPMEAETYFVFTLRAERVVRWQMFDSEQRALEATGSE